ncbi:Cyclin/Brf1-like TBP-binding protein, putative isoform 1 [Hibiscus syriacus]|uniref:Cyclin/Brf1-like TBP-binding protein, putative isoform 1 n=1 Tax=Hibiscus syriacus TaxID=106335 RepID=A0A6A3BCG2_HIBSY|nr:Cyclin/Brf1-like TBP-binding protein, putative isoform 1 [Hibiscus syriacus]
MLMISMEKRGFKVTLVVLFLGFSHLLISCAAVPATRSLNSNTELLTASVPDLLAQNERNWSETEEMIGEYLGDGLKEERMLLPSTDDYSGTGPNPKHDPTLPPLLSPH